MKDKLAKKAFDLIPEAKTDRLLVFKRYLAGTVKVLKPKQQERFDKMIRADKLLTAGYGENTVVRLLMKEGEAQSTAYKIVYDTLEVFGDAANTSKKGQRRVFYELYMINAIKAREDGDYAASNAALAKAAELKGLLTEDAGEDINALFNINLMFTSDIDALRKARSEENTLDIDSEEV